MKESANEDLYTMLVRIGGENLSAAQDVKKEILENEQMLTNLRVVLQDMKERISLNPILNHQDDGPDERISKVDNMLLAEGVAFENERGEMFSSDVAATAAADPMSPNEVVIENQEYRTKLTQIKEVYNIELKKYHSSCDQFTRHVINLLEEHDKIRPVSQQEMERMVKIIHKKFNEIQLQLKQSTCEAVMILRSRFLDARRKRRNFSKQATDILNEYFYAHLANPYPSEEAKEGLARRCSISVSQVSNWFGNKRIRYKKNIGKAQEEANMYAARRATGESPYEQLPPLSQSSSGNMLSPPPNGAGSQDEWPPSAGAHAHAQQLGNGTPQGAGSTSGDYGTGSAQAHQYYSDGSDS